MPSCEKCWADAHRPFADRSVPEEYARLLETRDAAGHTCTPEQQAGPDATECPACHRMTAHQLCRVCMACGHDPARPVADGEEVDRV